MCPTITDVRISVHRVKSMGDLVAVALNDASDNGTVHVNVGSSLYVVDEMRRQLEEIADSLDRIELAEIEAARDV